MKKIMNKIKNLIAHITFILALCFIVLWILDYYNPAMDLLNNAVTGRLLLLEFAGAGVLSVSFIKDHI